MSMEELTPIFILGPTGCGKSQLAVELAERMGCAEIVSADAYQVYRDMPILTAAPRAGELERVPHHLIGFLETCENNDAAAHAHRAEQVIAEIQTRGNRPIVTGGSGLYVKFISHGISPAPPSDAALRAKLNALPLQELVARLKEADPEGAAHTNLQNPRYVARNLEIVMAGVKPLSHWKKNWQHAPAGPGFILTRETPELDERIAQRAHSMIEDGVVDEVRALGELSATASKTLGLNEVQSFIAGEVTRDELEQRLTLITRQYAKRQRTWLRRESWLISVDARHAPVERVLNALFRDNRT